MIHHPGPSCLSAVHNIMNPEPLTMRWIAVGLDDDDAGHDNVGFYNLDPVSIQSIMT